MKKVLIPLVIVLSAGLLGLVAWRVVEVRRARQTASRPSMTTEATVSVVAVARRDMVERVTLTGTIRPRNEVDVFTKLPGRVEQVLVQVGDFVKEGQTLAVIEHREIALGSQQAEAQLQAALAGLERAKIGLEAAAAAHKRNETLRKDNVIPQADFERVEFGYREARAGVLAAESQVATARAAAALAAQGVANSRVTTPIAGTVTRRLVNVGTAAGQAYPLFQVQDVAVLKLDSTASASEFARLKVGQAVEVTASDVPGVAVPARVSTLSPTLEAHSRRASVEVEISNPDGRLMPNMVGQAVVEVGRRPGVLAIPATAIVTTPAGRVVFVVRDGRAVEVRPALGVVDRGQVAVESGLVEGDQVVVAGQAALVDGVAVKVVPAPEERAGAR